jgi:vacuolar-type H+-ATPase subunit H
MSQRSILDDIKSKLEKVGEDIKNTADKVADAVKEAASAAEEKVKAAYQEAVEKVQNAVENAKETAKETLEKIIEVALEISIKAKEVVDKTKQDLAYLKQKSEDKISALVEKAKAHGEGTLTCVTKNREKIAFTVESSGKMEITALNHNP